MKTQITVAWMVNVEIDVDTARMEDEAYLDEIRDKAAQLAGTELNWKDGIIHECEDFPELVE